MLDRPHRPTQLPFGLRQVYDVLRTGGVAASRRSFRAVWLALFLVLAVLLGFALVRFVIAPSVGHAQGADEPVARTSQFATATVGNCTGLLAVGSRASIRCSSQHLLWCLPDENRFLRARAVESALDRGL